MNYKIVNTYPHDINAYTQGFEFYNGVLLEGTGQYKESTLRKTNYKTREKLMNKIKLEDKYFGERNHGFKRQNLSIDLERKKAGFVYDAKTFKLVKTFSFETEGWELQMMVRKIII